EVVVLEAGDRVGGKVRVSDVGGVPVDEGADSMLRRIPYAVELAESVGLELISPAVGEAGVWVRGKVRPMPTGTLMGIPTDFRALARSGVLPWPSFVRALGGWLPARRVTEDVAIGRLVDR